MSPAAAPDAAPASSPQPAPDVGGPYARYLLGVLIVVYLFNFLDRQILSILAEEIRRDLGVSDEDLGFLYGTAFAVFYAVFGIPLGRLADAWSRRGLIALGLAVWSGMTALSGVARSFGELAAARIGVGIGEASANPAAYSMLSDSFPPARRATVLALYSTGIYLGSGLGLGIGGLVVDAWNEAFAGRAAPFGLRGWQVAYMVVGVPGLLLALWVRSLREPVRGAAEGLVVPPEPHPWRAFGRELAAVLPPFTLLHLAAAGGATTARRNAGAAAGIASGAAALVALTGDTAQWYALGVGLYAAVSWSQALALRDPESFSLIFGAPALRWTALGFGCLAFTGYGFGFWVPPFVQRIHGVSAAESGLLLGGTAAAAGWLGVTLGGVAADRWRLSRAEGRLYWGIVTALAPLPIGAAFLWTGDVRLAYLLNVPLSALGAMWIGAGASTMQDLVLPRMRASAAAAYLLVITFVGLALGPYGIGKASAALGDLRIGMGLAFGANLLAVACLARGARHLRADEARVRERARHATAAT
jgi:MFS family permease